MTPPEFDANSLELPSTPMVLWKEVHTPRAALGTSVFLVAFFAVLNFFPVERVGSVEMSVNGLLIVEAKRRFYHWSRITALLPSDSPEIVCTINLTDGTTLTLGPRHVPRRGDVERIRCTRSEPLRLAFRLANG